MKYILFIILIVAFQYVFCIDKKYDYVVIGGGTSGSVVASRLSENKKFKVLLIEAGTNENDNELIKNISNFMDTQDTNLRWNTHKIKDDSILSGLTDIPIMRVLGGASAGNGGGYERGDSDDWEKIANYLGDESWKMESLEQHFEKIEKAIGLENELGKNGIFTIDFGQESSLSNAWANVADEFNLPIHDSFSNENKTYGFAFEPSANINGYRQHAANTYIENIASDSLTVLTESQVTKIVLNKRDKKIIANAVEFYHRGKYHEVKVKHEIILSAGVFYSPFILKHSGIGYEEHSPHKYIELSGVGKNLIDNSGFVMLFTNNIESSNKIKNVVPIALLNSTDETKDTFVIFKPSPGMFVVVLVANNHGSNGTVSLYDSNPFSMPKIDYKVISGEEEIERMKNRIEKIREIMSSDAMSQFEPFEILPGNDADLKKFIRENNYHSNHFVGTCKMGPRSDQTSVVDNKFKVKGVEKLRVIDTSIIPFETKMGNMGAALMLGEKGADEILSQFSSGATDATNFSIFIMSFFSLFVIILLFIGEYYE